MAKYAKTTRVPISRSKQQIEKLLLDWGIEEFFFGTSPRGDGIGFKFKGRIYRFNVPIPDRNKFRFETHYEQALRQRWRILFMSLKMKLEEIDAGLVGFEDQFLSMMCLPNGTTVADFMKLPENIALLQKTEMPRLLTGQIAQAEEVK